MSDQHRQTMPARRKRLIRTASLLVALMLCLLLVQAAAANADVMKKYRGAYKNKLNYYRNQMDAENTFFTAWKNAAESTSNQLSIALADPDHPENVEIIKSVAVDQRTQLQDATRQSRDKLYANIAAFRAKAATWFKTTADKNRFKARLTTMKSGFKQLLSADEDLMSAFYFLGVNADVSSAIDEVMTAGMTSVTAEDLFEKGLSQLRALQ